MCLCYEVYNIITNKLLTLKYLALNGMKISNMSN